MSWDLLVATHHAPSASAVKDALGAEEKHVAQGSLEPPDANVLVSRSNKAGAAAAFTVDGPRVIEVDDLPEALAAGVLSPRFLLEVSVPDAASADARTVATRLAKRIAERFQGAVYDPQADEVLWPRSRARVYTPSTKEERIRVVELSWYLADSAAIDELPEQLLPVLRTACPEALPRRYGDYEPFQHKLEPGREQELNAFWRGLRAKEISTALYWKSASPCFGGSASSPDRRETFPDGRRVAIPGTTRCTKLSLSFDGRALHGDERWCSAVVGLFSSMAAKLGALYAAAHVQRNVIAKRGLWYDDASERLPMPRCFFAGLPPVPTWLAWFGREYAAHVAEAVGTVAERQKDGAWLFRAGLEPMDVDQLANHFPALPARLVYAAHLEAPSAALQHVPAEYVPLG